MIIPLARPKKEKHYQGEAICIQCKHEWQAVAPEGTLQLECPACSTHKGLWKFPFGFDEGKLVRVCGCGNKLFYLSPEGHLCANCGTYQMY